MKIYLKLVKEFSFVYTPPPFIFFSLVYTSFYLLANIMSKIFFLSMSKLTYFQLAEITNETIRDPASEKIFSGGQSGESKIALSCPLG